MLNFACVSAVTVLISSPLAAEDAPHDSAKPLPHATLLAPEVISTGDYESHAHVDARWPGNLFSQMAPNFALVHLRFALSERCYPPPTSFIVSLRGGSVPQATNSRGVITPL